MIDQLELIFQNVPMKSLTYRQAQEKVEYYRQIRYRAIDSENWTAKVSAERKLSYYLEAMEELKQEAVKV